MKFYVFLIYIPNHDLLTQNSGEFHDVPFYKQMRLLREKYGDIVKLEGLIFRPSMIFLFNPEFCERMYRLEGPQPHRVAMDALHNYRQMNKQLFKQPGLATRFVKKSPASKKLR